MSSIEERMIQLRETAAEYAKAAANRAYLEEYKKSLLAILQKQFEPEHSSNAAQEREARASKKYLEFLDGYRMAVEASEKLRWDLEIAKIGASLWQTKQASRRAERQGYGA